MTPSRQTLSIALAIGLITLAPLARAADSPEYGKGYQEGYRAALEAARKAIAEGRTTEFVRDATPATADTAPPAAAAPAVPATVAAATPPVAKGLGDWWNHSSLRYAQGMDSWQNQARLQGSFSSLDGNNTGNATMAKGEWFARQGRWTNELSLNIERRNLAAVGGPANFRDYRLLQESLRYDLDESLYASGGFIYERDDLTLINSRVTGLMGLGRYWLDNSTLRLNTYAGLGRLNERYMSYVPDHVGVSQRSSGLLYIYEQASWRINDQWNLRQGFRLMRDLQKSGQYQLDQGASLPPSAQNPQGFEIYSAVSQTYRFRTVAALDLDYKLSPSSTLSLGLESRFDSNPWPGVVKRDTIRRVVLNYAF